MTARITTGEEVEHVSSGRSGVVVRTYARKGVWKADVQMSNGKKFVAHQSGLRVVSFSF